MPRTNGWRGRRSIAWRTSAPVIAHRLTTVQKADRGVVTENGRIV
jgi:ABC-type transport system involved in Fe-S cluster assembly fused permease/ATPase subunit